MLVMVSINLGCGDRTLEGQTIITFQNTATQAVFLSGNEAPFNVFGTSAGEKHRWYLSPGAGEILCSQCEAACSESPSVSQETMHPIYIEVPGGKSFNMSWDGMVYRWKEKGCTCGKTCYEPVLLEHGEYEITLKYRSHLPLHDDTSYTREPGDDGLDRLVGDKEGAADTQDAHSRKLDYHGQPQIKLDLWDDCKEGDEINSFPEYDHECKGITGCRSLIAWELGCQCSFCQHGKCVQAICVD
jgi:hypothetical protein